jgi:hypothetical protein
MGGIFISYRRDDSAPYARLLSDSLGDHFGPEMIFRDIDTIAPGEDFPDAIAGAVGRCQVLLAVIGDNWLDAQQDGRRRLDHEGDYLRLEIAAALQRNIVVVPVLLEQTRMPDKAELPPDLAELADRNAIRLADDGWDDGVRRLAVSLQKPLGVAPAREPGALRPGPEPADGSRSRPGTGDGGTGSKRTAQIVGALLVVMVLAGLSRTLGGRPGPRSR